MNIKSFHDDILWFWVSELMERQILSLTFNCRGPGSSVGIATAYGLDGPEIESRWSEIFRTCPDRP